jgi:hypothetical protein
LAFVKNVKKKSKIDPPQSTVQYVEDAVLNKESLDGIVFDMVGSK